MEVHLEVLLIGPMKSIAIDDHAEVGTSTASAFPGGLEVGCLLI